MSTEESGISVTHWSPDDIPADEAEKLQKKEEARARRGAKRAAEGTAAGAEGTSEAPAPPLQEQP